MTIKIGKASHPTHKPADLDAALIAMTGCDAVETAQALAGLPTAGRVAAALHPFLAEGAPTVPELARDIAPALPEVLVAVKKLYAERVTTPPAEGDGE